MFICPVLWLCLWFEIVANLILCLLEMFNFLQLEQDNFLFSTSQEVLIADHTHRLERESEARAKDLLENEIIVFEEKESEEEVELFDNGYKDDSEGDTEEED